MAESYRQFINNNEANIPGTGLRMEEFGPAEIKCPEIQFDQPRQQRQVTDRSAWIPAPPLQQQGQPPSYPNALWSMPGATPYPPYQQVAGNYYQMQQKDQLIQLLMTQLQQPVNNQTGFPYLPPGNTSHYATPLQYRTPPNIYQAEQLPVYPTSQTGPYCNIQSNNHQLQHTENLVQVRTQEIQKNQTVQNSVPVYSMDNPCSPSMEGPIPTGPVPQSSPVSTLTRNNLPGFTTMTVPFNAVNSYHGKGAIVPSNITDNKETAVKAHQQIKCLNESPHTIPSMHPSQGCI